MNATKEKKIKKRKPGPKDPEVLALLGEEQQAMTNLASPRRLTPAEYRRVNWGECDELQRRFVEEYVKDWNGTRAVMRAGYENKSYASAAFRAYQLLKQNYIRACVSQCQDMLARKTFVTKERVLRELARIGFSDIRDYGNEDGTLQSPLDMDDDSAAAVKELEQVDYFEGVGEDKQKLGVTKKLRLHDKKAALDSICKLMGYNPSEKHEVSGSVTHDHKHVHGLNWDDMPLDLLMKIKGEVDARQKLLSEPEGANGVTINEEPT